MRGKFITFEGGEGCGKTTQVALLERAFIAAELPHRFTREPGGTPSAEIIRRLLVESDAPHWHAKTETLLFYAARMEHVHQLILPALAQGEHVVSDRFADSTFVYQGVARHIENEWIERLHRLTLGDLAPDLTIILDIAPDAGLSRAAQRKGRETKFEELGLDFHMRVREGFLARAAKSHERYVVIDADQNQHAIHSVIVNAVSSRLGLALPNILADTAS